MTVEQWLNNNKLAISTWKKKYQFQGESFEQWLDRISDGNQELRKLIFEKKFFFGGRILANLNTHTGQGISNCLTEAYVEDNLIDIMQTATNLALSYQKEAGVGVCLSKIRPKGAKIGSKGIADGVIGFLKIYDAITSNISRGNERRGALLAGLHCDHPDVIDFINIKKGNTGTTGLITSANLSVLVTDEFMEHYEKKESYRKDFIVESTGEVIPHIVDTVKIMNTIVDTPQTSFEPGILFVDRYKENHLFGGTYKDKELFNNACHTYDSLLLTDKGYLKIGELAENNQTVNAWNGYEFSEVKPFKTSDSEKIYEVVFSNGSINKVTRYHKFHINGNIKRTHELVIGDKVTKFNLPQNNVSLEPVVISVTELNGEQATYCATEPKNHTLVVNGIMSGNCSEFIGAKGTVCLLGSLNLYEFVNKETRLFDYEEFSRAIKIAVRALDNAHDYGIGRNALPSQNDKAKNYRGVGLGITGLADALIKMGIKYGSQQAVEFARTIGKTMKNYAIETSQLLAQEFGQPKGVKELEDRMEELGLPHYKGLRNNSLLSIAPAGSLSLLADVSSGVEPVFRDKYMRKTETLHDKDAYYEVYHRAIQEAIDFAGGNKPDYCIDTRDVKVTEKVDMISALQESVDLSISNTTNFKEDTTVEEIKELYIYGWKQKCTGLTVYVDGSIEGVLNDIKEKKEEETPEIEFGRGIMAKVPEDTIYYPREMNHGCGKAKVMVGYSPSENRITDVYHIEKGMGGCTKNTQGEAILISQVLRLGGNLEDIKKSFAGIGACTSCTVSRMKGNKVDGMNCPNILLKIVLEANKELVIKDKPVVVSKKKEEKVDKKDIPVTISDKVCPVCNTPLTFNSGCNSCLECGWSKCD